MPFTTFSLLGGGKIKHFIIYYFVIYHLPFIFCGAKVLLFFDIRKFICKNRPFYAGIGRNRDEGVAVLRLGRRWLMYL